MVVSDARDDNLTGLLLAGRYELGGVHARGALCAVYQAHDTVLMRTIAVKAPPTSVAPAYREALEATGSLSYPAYLAVYDVIEQDDRLYIAQEFIDGRPLSAYLTDGAPTRRAISLALQLARAVAYAHDHDVTHGDLTPAAILIDRSAVVHVNNLRLPPDWQYFDTLAAEVGRSEFTSSADALGAALRADDRVRDVWSVASALWSLVTRPAGDEAGGREYREDATPELQSLIARALDLAREPAEPANAAEAALTTAEGLALALEALDETLARAASAQRTTAPLAVRTYREEREGTAVRPRIGDGPLRVGRRHDDARFGLPNAPTQPGAGGYTWSDPNQTQPASDSPYVAPAPLLRLPQRPAEWGGYEARNAATPGLRLDTRAVMRPAWPTGQAGEAATAQFMRPWVWALIGVALFVAFFLVGYLVFPQIKLF